MRRATILVAILAFVPLTSATAQVRPGARVRVTGHFCQPFYSNCVGGSPQQYVGTFVTWEADTLVTESNGDILALPLDSVTTLEVSAGRRSPGTAVTLSALGTAVPIALGLTGRGVGLLAGGLVLGPALGYVYAGEAGRGMAHAGIRAAILGAAVGGAVAICSAGNCNIGIFGESGGELVPAAFFLLGGVVATTVLAVRDINRAGDRLRARNQPLNRLRVSFVPQRDGRFGLGASVRF
jgi:hypothetical protein